MKSRRAAGVVLKPLEDWFAGLREEEGEIGAAEHDLSASILFVGGNETQQRRKSGVRNVLSADFPNIRATFRFTGWSSNWGREVGAIGAAISDVDAVVVCRFIRTGLGCFVRREAGELEKPWVACTGSGQDSMARAIVEATKLIPTENRREFR